MRGSRPAIALTLLLAVIAASIFFALQGNRLGGALKQGLDLQGGMHLRLRAVQEEGQPPVTKEAVDKAKSVIERRVNEMGLSEPRVEREGADSIVVELAGVKDPEQARRLVGKTAVLKFVDYEGKGSPMQTGQPWSDELGTVLFTGEALVDAQAGYQQNNPVVSFKLNDEAAKLFAEITGEYATTAGHITIVLDDQVISSPSVNSAITGGEGIIQGHFTPEEAKELADLLRGGSLPINLQIEEVRQVSATLGANSLAQTLKAGLWAYAAVALFLVLIYRLPGLLASVALAVYVLLVLATLYAFEAVLTLPGIAGIILGIGMAVDANVLVFERIREELGAGMSLATSFKEGFKRAFGTILDSNITTLVASVALYYFGTGAVKGFAITLSIGVVASMFTAVTLSRWLIGLSLQLGWFKGSFLPVAKGGSR